MLNATSLQNQLWRDFRVGFQIDHITAEQLRLTRQFNNARFAYKYVRRGRRRRQRRRVIKFDVLLKSSSRAHFRQTASMLNFAKLIVIVYVHVFRHHVQNRYVCINE